MLNRPTTIRPGLLISLGTTLQGGVSYTKTTLEEEHMQGAAAVARWETTREIQNAEEHAAAVVARGAARSAITRVCCQSAAWLLCPQAREEELRDAIADARTIIDRHNGTNPTTRVRLSVIVGRIAADDAEAARAIAAEVRELLGAMESATRAADPEAIRDAASKARALAGMLTDDAQRKVTAAIAEVRAVARDIVRRVGESGEQAAAVVQGLKLEALASARFAVLDLDDSGQAADLPAQEGRAVDFEPAPDAAELMPFSVAAAATNLDLF